ncbi:MAG: nitroreductase [Chitinophagales bacterium]|nr:nitroreductase [Chitinophagales bacterium]
MNKAQTVIQNIKERRTIKPEQCSNEKIPDADVWTILECANWAPTHGYTEPWRFVVFTDEGKHTISKAHADMYKNNAPADKFKQVKYNGLIERAKSTSHIIAIINKRGANAHIPKIEEIEATAMAVQNMQLAASAMGYAAYIHSGGMTFTDEMKNYLGFEAEDDVLGFLYLGVPNEEIKPGRRITPIQDKVKWIDK